MKNNYKNDRVKDLEAIIKRHESRNIEGCTSWRHFVVHEDRGWLLNAMHKVQAQVEMIGQALEAGDDRQALEAEIQKLLGMFKAEALNHLGDDEK